MNNNTYAINITAGEKYEFILKTLSKHQNNIHYIGISANMVKFLFKNSCKVNK